MSLTDPGIGFHFKIELSGAITGYFLSVSGMGSETQVTDHNIMDANNKEVTRKIPGRLTFGDITLKRGVTTNIDFWQWREQARTDVTGARKSGSIILMDMVGKEIARWDFDNAWPSKITGPEASTESGEVAVEEITIVHEGIVRVK